MALTTDYHEIVQDRIRRDPEFRELLLSGGIERLLTGEVEVARIILRDYIIATVGFDRLGVLTGRSPESLERMLGPEGDPSASDLLEVIACTLRDEGLALRVSTVRAEPEADDLATTGAVAAL